MSTRPGEIRWRAFVYATGHACSNCRGLCCEHFDLHFASVDAQGGLSFADARKRFRAQAGSEYDREFDFMERNFFTQPVPADLQPIWRRYLRPARFNAEGKPEYENHDRFSITCRQFVNGRCQEYANRPGVCRGFLCAGARGRERPILSEFPYQEALAAAAGKKLSFAISRRDYYRLLKVEGVRRNLTGVLWDRIHRLTLDLGRQLEAGEVKEVVGGQPGTTGP